MPNVNLTINGKDKASGAIKGVTGSIIKAQIAIGALSKATSFLTQFTKQSIKNSIDFAESESKLGVVFSGLTEEVDKAANSIKGLSNKAVVDLLGNTGDLLTGLGFTKDSALDLSTQVQKLSVDLASFTNFSGGAKGASAALTKALLGERESIKQLGISINETDVQQKLLEEGKESLTGFALKQAKAEATLTLALEQSQNALGDYERTQDSLANRQRELSNQIEDISIELGDRLTPVMEWATSRALEFAKNIGEIVKIPLSETLEEERNELNTLIIKLSQANTKEEERKKILNKINEIAPDVRKEIDKEGDSQETLGRILAETNQQYLNRIIIQQRREKIENALNKAGNLKNEIFDRENNLLGTITKRAEKYGVSLKTLVNKSLDEQVKLIDEAQIKTGDYTVKLLEQSGNYKKLQTATSAYNNTMEKSSNLQKEADLLAESLGITYEDVEKKAKKLGETTEKEAEKGKKSWKDYFDSISSAGVETFEAFAELGMSHFERQEEALAESLENQLSMIDNNTQLQLEALGLQDLSKSESLQKEIDELQEQLSTTKSLKDQERLHDQISEKQTEVKKAKIIEDGEKQKAASRKASAKKEFDLKIKAFNTQKALDLVTAGTQLALGIASAAASGAQFGPAAVAMIPLLVSLVTAAGAVGIATIASKQPPSAPAFATGVTGFSGGAAIVGEAGPELVTLGGNSNVITNENLQNLLQSNLGGGGITINNLIVQANNVQELVEELTEIQRFETARV